MMAMLYAQRIMNGKLKFSDVPRLLKEQVKEILIESGMEELLESQKGGGPNLPLRRGVKRLIFMPGMALNYEETPSKNWNK